MAVMCVLGEREVDSGGAVQVKLDEKLRPFLRDAYAGLGHLLEGGFADAVEGAAYVPGGDKAGCVGFFRLFQGVDE